MRRALSLVAGVIAVGVGIVHNELGKDAFQVDASAARAAFPIGRALGGQPPATSVSDGAIQFGRWRGAVADPTFPRPMIGDRIRAFFRLKHWHFVSVRTDRFFFALAIANLNYVSNVFAYLVDLRDPKARVAQYSALSPLASGITTTDVPGKECSIAGGLFTICPSRDTGFEVAGHVYLSHKGEVRDRHLSFDFHVAEPQPFSMVFPLPSGRPAYVQKSAGAASSGRLFLEGEDGQHRWDDGLAVSDYTASWAERETRWRWASMSAKASVRRWRGDGADSGTARSTRVGFHLSGLMYEVDGTSAENTIWVDDRVVAVGAVSFSVPETPDTENWRVSSSDGAIDLVFTPWGMRSAREDFHFVVSDFVQPYGTFSGTLRFADGDETVQIEVQDQFGVVENHFAMW